MIRVARAFPWCLALALAVLLAGPAQRADASGAQPVIISTDLATGLVNGQRAGPSDIDDGLATVMALHAGQLDVRGVVVTYGNNDVGPEVIAARRLVRNLLRSPVPLVEGAAGRLSDRRSGGSTARRFRGDA